jgi:DNA mismatch endonuclease (patch repair protein)
MHMADTVDRLTRSRMMARVRGKNTKPEVALRRALHRLGLRYRIHASDLPGRPDVVLPKYRAAIQIQGCFWHRHEHCAYATTPASNRPFWKKKFRDTIARDKRMLEALRQRAWRVAIVWECALRREQACSVADQIYRWLHSRKRFKEVPRQ